MAELRTPIVSPGKPTFTELCQVTITNDEQISSVNRLLAEGWQLVHIGQRSDATVYVLGQMANEPKHHTGFLATG